MVRCSEDIPYAENSKNVLEVPGRELRSIIGQQLHGGSIHEKSIAYKGVCDVSCEKCLQRYSPYQLRVSIADHKNVPISLVLYILTLRECR